MQEIVERMTKGAVTHRGKNTILPHRHSMCSSALSMMLFLVQILTIVIDEKAVNGFRCRILYNIIVFQYRQEEEAPSSTVNEYLPSSMQHC